MVDVLKFNSADSVKSQSSGPWKLNNAKKKETRNSFRSESGGELDERGESVSPGEKETRNTQVFQWAREALKLIRAPEGVLIEILESLILAQDERWRRA